METNQPVKLNNIRNISVSGKIGSGASTLASRLAEILHWEFLDGGKLFRKLHTEMHVDIVQTNNRPDHFDLEYEEKIKRMLTEKDQQVIQSHLAGFDAQGIASVFKILVTCEDIEGNDKPEIRIDRLVNRDGKSIEEAKFEVLEREKQNLDKWRRLYANGDPNWVNWDKKYYDLVINTFSHNQDESVQIALEAINYKT